MHTAISQFTAALLCWYCTVGMADAGKMHRTGTSMLHAVLLLRAHLATHLGQAPCSVSETAV